MRCAVVDCRAKIIKTLKKGMGHIIIDKETMTEFTVCDECRGVFWEGN